MKENLTCQRCLKNSTAHHGWLIFRRIGKVRIVFDICDECHNEWLKMKKERSKH